MISSWQFYSPSCRSICRLFRGRLNIFSDAMNAGKGWRHWKTAPDLQVKSCLTEDCPLMCVQCRSSGHCCIDSCRSSRGGPCLKTSRILQIQSCWQESKMMFPIVNWRELDSWLLFLEKIHPSSMSLLSFVSFLWGQMQLALSWRILFCLFLGYTLPFSQGVLESQDFHIVWMYIGSKTIKKPQIWCWNPVKYLQLPLFQKLKSFWETSSTSYNLSLLEGVPVLTPHISLLGLPTIWN